MSHSKHKCAKLFLTIYRNFSDAKLKFKILSKDSNVPDEKLFTHMKPQNKPTNNYMYSQQDRLPLVESSSLSDIDGPGRCHGCHGNIRHPSNTDVTRMG